MRKVEAAGGVVWRENANKQIEILLVHRPKYLDWSFPKGKLDRGETPAIAAVREVEEETGLKVILQASLSEQEYDAEDNTKRIFKYRKHVVYFIAQEMKMDCENNQKIHSLRLPVKSAKLSEIDETCWVNLNDAKEILTYRDDRDLLSVFEKKLKTVKDQNEQGFIFEIEPLERIEKKRWHGKKSERPLTAASIGKSVVLSQELSAWGINKVILQKDKRHFHQTVTAFILKTGFTVEIADKFTLKQGDRVAYVRKAKKFFD